MPDRIIRESICTSDTLNQLSDFEERFWHRLIVNCDDYGRFDARPAILKGRLFPLMEGKTLRNMSDALHKLASVGLVELYEVEGKPFLRVVTWDKYQRIRAKRSKFPEPDGNCCQMPSNVAVIQSESESNPNPIQFESRDAGSEAEPAVILLPLNRGEYPITPQQAEEWSKLYPAVDVMQELRKMRGWLDANPTRRKTRAGVLRFVTGWLAKEQDRGKTGKPNGSAASVDRSPSFDLEEYEQAVLEFQPVYRKENESC